MRRPWLLAGLWIVSGCKVVDRDLSDKTCPCAEGYTCDMVANRCVKMSAVVDAGPWTCDAALEPVALPQALFYEGFEPPFPNTTSWALTAGNVDNMLRYRGTSSYHFRNDGTENTFIYPRVFRPTPSPDLYVRVFALLKSPTPPRSCGIFLFKEYNGPLYALLDVVDGTFRLSTDVPDGGSVTPSNIVMPTDCWQCLEWHLRYDAQGFMELSLNGNPVLKTSMIQTRPDQGVLTDLLLGWLGISC